MSLLIYYTILVLITGLLPVMGILIFALYFSCRLSIDLVEMTRVGHI